MHSHNFDTIKANLAWDFGRKIDNIYTHGYHSYPAKFPPAIVRKIFDDYCKDINSNKRIIDIFAGCGTTLVEAKARGYDSIGVDINPVARMITQAKNNPIEPDVLDNVIKNFLAKKRIKTTSNLDIFNHEKLLYWFEQGQLVELENLYREITNHIEDKRIQTFFLCAFSNILKSTSRWLQSSTKPQIDPNKVPREVNHLFGTQLHRMNKANERFHTHLKENRILSTKSKFIVGDARNTKIPAESAGMLITSPPYVTSYEYGELHQLTALCFNYTNSIPEFRKKFVGSKATTNSDKKGTLPQYAQNICDEIAKAHSLTGKNIEQYYHDLSMVANEMYRIISPGGIAAVIIGNTHLRKINTRTAEIMYSFMQTAGFSFGSIIKRNISAGRVLPTTRDPNTGKFTKSSNQTKSQAYPHEFILIARK